MRVEAREAAPNGDEGVEPGLHHVAHAHLRGVKARRRDAGQRGDEAYVHPDEVNVHGEKRGLPRAQDGHGVHLLLEVLKAHDGHLHQAWSGEHEEGRC